MTFMRRLFTFLLVLTPLLATSVVAQEAELRERTKIVETEDELDDIRTRDGSDTPGKGYVRQGYDHMRQGNTSKARNDFMGRQYAPYGVETYTPLRQKLEDKMKSPSWELDVDLYTPKRIEINGEVYWYVLFEIANRNWRYSETTTDTTESIAGPGGDPNDPAYHRIESTQGDPEGVPVETNIDFFVEVYRVDAHARVRDIGVAGAEDDDLEDAMGKEARRIEGEDVVGEGELDGTSSNKASKMAEAMYANSRHAVQSVSDPFVLRQIAERERMWVWNYDKRQYLLEPTSAFQRDIGIAHELNPSRLDGPICLPTVDFVTTGDEEEPTMVVRYPGVFTNNYAFAGYFGEGDPLELPHHPDRGIELVSSSSHPMWGKLAPLEYADGDVVGRFGEVLQNGQPGYLTALRSGGMILSGNDGRAAQNAGMIGRLRMRPNYRVYNNDDKVLLGYDTGIPHAAYANMNYSISGLIVDQYDQLLYNKIVAERARVARGARSDEEIGLGNLRAADVNRDDEAVSISDVLEEFGEVPGRGPIPVKLIDHKGRPIKRSIVTYKVGDTVSQDEWEIYASRNTDAEVSNPGFPYELQAGDMMVGKPKIKMGRTRNTLEREVLRRAVNQQYDEEGNTESLDVVDYETGRLYDPHVVRPTDFYRDPDGSFFCNRVAPVPSGANLAPGEDYVYAPLGAPSVDASPVPAFDRNDAYGAWVDYVDPITGDKVPLRDASGELVYDEYDQLQYLKEYEYEFVYLYELAPERSTNADADFSKRLTEVKNGVPVFGTYKMVDVDCFVKGDKNYGPAVYRTREEYWRWHDIYTADDQGNSNVEAGWVKEVRTVGFTESPISSSGSGTAAPIDAPANDDDKEIVVRTFSEAPAEWVSDGLTVSSVRMSLYARDVFFAKLGKGAEPNPRDPKYFDTPTSPVSPAGELPSIYTRWTFPAPLVELEGRGSDAEIKVYTEVALPIWEDVRTGDFARSHLHYISKRFGAFVFKETMKDWDFMNVQVRGLRSAYKREGLKTTTYTTRTIGGEGGGDQTDIQRKLFTPNYVRQDWIYQKRFRRLGDEFDVDQDLIEAERELWYLRAIGEEEE